MKVAVDQSKCMGHARCIAVLPEVFHWLPVDDHAIVPDDLDVNAYEQEILQAALMCPEGAINVDP